MGSLYFHFIFIILFIKIMGVFEGDRKKLYYVIFIAAISFCGLLMIFDLLVWLCFNQMPADILGLNNWKFINGTNGTLALEGTAILHVLNDNHEQVVFNPFSLDITLRSNNTGPFHVGYLVSEDYFYVPAREMGFMNLQVDALVDGTFPNMTEIVRMLDDREVFVHVEGFVPYQI